ncbi:hypothetical protein BO80DRAFT_188797, partial [Aspergillus ibericus CBS 121593]
MYHPPLQGDLYSMYDVFWLDWIGVFYLVWFRDDVSCGLWIVDFGCDAWEGWGFVCYV